MLEIPTKYQLNTYVRYDTGLFGRIEEGKIFSVHGAERREDGTWNITYLLYSPTGVDHLVGEEQIL